MSDLSSLEEQFPRIAQEIEAFWDSPSRYELLQNLLIDKRGGRKGFPEDVHADLSMLLSITPRPKGPYDIWNDALDTEKT